MRGYWCENSTCDLSERLIAPACPHDHVLLRTRFAVAEPPDERPAGFRGVPGSQFVGTVDSAAPSLTSWIGKRAVASPLVTCGTCEFCRGGAAAVCRSRAVMGVEGRDGGLAELVAVPARNLVELPARLPDEHAVFAWTTARAARIAAAARAGRSAFVTVLGDRPLALLVAQLLSRQCEHVRVLGHGVWSSGECERIGLRFRSIDDVGRRHDQQIVVDCSGGTLAPVAVHLLRARGLLILVNSPRLAAQLDIGVLASLEATVTGVSGGTIVEGVSLLTSGAVDVRGMIGARVAAPVSLALPAAPATLVEFVGAPAPAPV